MKVDVNWRGSKSMSEDWKLASPDDDRGDTLCPFCGAYSKRHCELEEEMGCCPWEESEPDPDYLRDLREGADVE